MHMTTRRPALLALLFGGLALLGLGACSGGGNPNVAQAQEAFDNQNYERALAYADSAIAQDTANANAEVRLLKAQALRNLADSTAPPEEYKELYQRAREVEQEAVRINPEVRSQIQTRRRLAYIQQMQGGAAAFNQARQQNDSLTYARAAAYFNAAHQLEPDSASPYLNEAFALLNSGQRGEVIEPLEMYTERADSISANTYQILGQLYLTNDRMDDGIGLLETATEEYPDNGDLQTLLLNAYQQSGQIDQAMERYREQIERNPDNATYRYNYGSLLLSAERYDAAIEQLERAVNLDPDNVRAHYNLGAAHVNKAVAINDSISAMQGSADEEAQQAAEERLNELVEQRRQAFQAAISPLERARELSEPGDQYYQSTCRSLFQAYAQMERMSDAEEVRECAGISEGQMNNSSGSGGGR
jgi:tetratricopeptide (TPR) repeat protein